MPMTTVSIETPPPAVMGDPQCWAESWKELRETGVKNKDSIVLTCDRKSPLSSTKFEARLVCCVRTLPRLNDVKNALKQFRTFRERSRSSIRHTDDPVSPNRCYDTEVHGRHCLPRPTIWKVGTSVEDGITVMDAIKGTQLMRILAPKQDILVTSLLHAPFRGFINRQLEVLNIEQPQDILNVGEFSLINTDYVWVGFADGSIRLFPADYRRVREQDRSVLLSKGELADLVYELPKQHKAAVVAITRSPCHDDGAVTDLVTANRLSSCIRELTAATSRGSREDREHLSLVCTASEDSCVVVWELKKIYRRLEEMRVSSRNARTLRFGEDASSIMSGEGNVVTFEVKAAGHHHGCSIRSTSTLVKVRPLFRLKGGVGGLRALNWVTSAVTTEGYQKNRDVVAMTRDKLEPTAPQLIKNRRAVQQMTRWEKREEHRVMLRLSEQNMREVEEELEQLMPPLAPEPKQRRRVNLIIAGDVHGTVHFWDIDEELEKCVSRASSVSSTSRTRSVSRDSRSCRSTAPSFDSSVSPFGQTARGDTMITSARSSVTRRSSRRDMSARHREISPGGRTGSEQREKPRRRRLVDDVAYKQNPSLSTSTCPTVDTKRRGRSRNTTGETGSKTPKKLTSQSPTVNRRGAQSVGSSTPQARSRSFTSSKTGVSQSRERGYMNPTSLGSTAVFHEPARVGSIRENGKSRGMSPQAKPCLSQPVRAFSNRAGQRTPGRRTMQTLEKGLSQASKPSRTRASRGLEPATESKPRRKSVGSSHYSIPGGTKNSHDDVCVGDESRRTSRVKQPIPEKESTYTVPWNSSRAPSVSSGAVSGRSHGGRQSTSEATHLHCSERGLESKLHMGDHQYMNDIYSRKAKCHMDLIEGGTVTGIAVDLPPVITVTMRRLPDPPEPHYSLLEQPTEEEIRHRELANSFYTLTDERALFLVFERMQFYVSVDRAIMNMQCVPKTRLSDSTHHVPSAHLPGMRVVTDAIPFTFDIVFRRHVLEMQPQPIVCMFMDHVRHQLWVARGNGVLSVFSTDTKSIITRVTNPEAEEAIGPPNLREWKRGQCEMALMGRQHMYLEKQKETRKDRHGYFTGFKPFSLMQQFGLVRLSLQKELNSASSLSFSITDSLEANITLVDDKCILDEHARNREFGLSILLEKLKICRQNAVKVRRAQRDNYNLLYNTISNKIGSLIGRCATFGVLHVARKLFWSWAHHRDYYPRHYVLRKFRQRRRRQLVKLQNAVTLNVDIRLRNVYFTKWLVSVRERRGYKQRLKLERNLGMKAEASVREKFANLMCEYTQLRRYWLLWKSALTPKVHSSPLVTFYQSATPLNSNGATQIFSTPFSYSSRRRSISHSVCAERDGLFQDIYALILQVRGLSHVLILFKWDESAESVLDMDDSWFDAIEAASEEAETRTAYALKLAVFKFALIPFLESLLSTAEGVLPYLREAPVSEEARSIIRGCLLCIDYLYADDEDLSSMLEAEEDDENGSPASKFLQEEKTHSVDDGTARRKAQLRQLFNETMECREFRTQMEAIASQRTVIEEFLRFFSEK